MAEFIGFIVFALLCYGVYRFVTREKEVGKGRNVRDGAGSDTEVK